LTNVKLNVLMVPLRIVLIVLVIFAILTV